MDVVLVEMPEAPQPTQQSQLRVEDRGYAIMAQVSEPTPICFAEDDPYHVLLFRERMDYVEIEIIPTFELV